MRNRIRHTTAEHTRNTFFQLPVFLFTSEFKGLSNDAKVLYALLRGRHELSVGNGWENDKGEVYLIMSRVSMAELLDVSENTVLKIVNELKKFELIEEERRGQGKANLLYLLQIKTCKNYNSRPSKNEVQNPQNLSPSNIDPSNIDFNYISNAREKQIKKVTKKRTEKETPTKQGSFDTDEFYELAKKRSYEADKGKDK